jgi:hypothetical protein
MQDSGEWQDRTTGNRRRRRRGDLLINRLPRLELWIRFRRLMWVVQLQGSGEFQDRTTRNRRSQGGTHLVEV